MEKAEFRKIVNALLYPSILVALLWIVKLIELSSNVNFTHYGLYPRQMEGLQGIILAVFIHSDWNHLINNSVPLLILGWALFYFYKGY